MKKIHKRLHNIISILCLLIFVSISAMVFSSLYNNSFIFFIFSHVLIITILLDIFCIIKLSSVIRQETKIREELFVQSLKSQYNIK